MAVVIKETVKRDSYTMLKLQEPTERLREIERWCYQTGCGKRVNLTSFSFSTDEELTMFRLKWC